MRAMLLAAGLGERMRPLTENTPKPLLRVGGRCLIEYHLERLVAAGFTEIVINLAYLGQQIEQMLGTGVHYGAQINYSDEGSEPLGTAGGIIHALPLLGNSPFLVVNSDIWCDYPLIKLSNKINGLAHLVLVDNPPHHPQGDFNLRSSSPALVKLDAMNSRLTFSGIGVYDPQLFKNCPRGKLALAPVLIEAMHSDQVTGEYYQGQWLDIGTPERLQQLDLALNEVKEW